MVWVKSSIYWQMFRWWHNATVSSFPVSAAVVPMGPWGLGDTSGHRCRAAFRWPVGSATQSAGSVPGTTAAGIYSVRNSQRNQHFIDFAPHSDGVVIVVTDDS